MNINSVSFKGLWSGPFNTEEIGTHKNFGSPVYRQEFVYHPFKNEAPSETRKAMNEKRGVFALDDDRNLDPYGPEAYYHTIVMQGQNLSITAFEYENLQKLKETPYENTSDLKYSHLNKTEEHKLFEKIV